MLDDLLIICLLYHEKYIDDVRFYDLLKWCIDQINNDFNIT